MAPGPKKRIPVPQGVQTAVLIANRHACCVCHKHRVQLHHIDGDPTNNAPSNLAALCLDHHDMASMQIGLTKKLKVNQVIEYKREWEEKCRSDVAALSRKRFTFYYCIYKNPPRIKEAYFDLGDEERKDAVMRLHAPLLAEQGLKDKDPLFGMNAVPGVNRHTRAALQSVFIGEQRPGYLGTFKPHPADPDYSTDSSTQEAMAAFHLYDLWCQVVCQTLAEARGTIPIEDLYSYGSEEELDQLIGRLVTFKLSIRGKNIRIPRYWQETPVGTLTARMKFHGRKVSVKMQVRTMYLFSDTAVINLENGRISGLGLFNGAVIDENGDLEITVVPLMIGAGGWNLHPEGYPGEFR